MDQDSSLKVTLIWTSPGKDNPMTRYRLICIHFYKLIQEINIIISNAWALWDDCTEMNGFYRVKMKSDVYKMNATDDQGQCHTPWHPSCSLASLHSINTSFWFLCSSCHMSKWQQLIDIVFIFTVNIKREWWTHLDPAWLLTAFFVRWYHDPISVWWSMSLNASRPSIELSTP